MKQSTQHYLFGLLWLIFLQLDIDSFERVTAYIATCLHFLCLVIYTHLEDKRKAS